MNEPEIAIRSIQHYLYCPHRWGLLEIDRAWAENFFVTKANLLHQRVHDPDNHYTARGKKSFVSVPVYCDSGEYNLYGVVDCLELTEDENGVAAEGLPGKYRLCIVEYKPSKPTGALYHEDDLMQVFAQKLCVDYVFGCDCDAALYYADVKRKFLLPLRENREFLEAKLKNLLVEMRENIEAGRIPEIRNGQKCSGCSMKDLCMPSAKGAKRFQRELQAVEKEWEAWRCENC